MVQSLAKSLSGVSVLHQSPIQFMLRLGKLFCRKKALQYWAAKKEITLVKSAHIKNDACITELSLVALQALVYYILPRHLMLCALA